MIQPLPGVGGTGGEGESQALYSTISLLLARDQRSEGLNHALRHAETLQARVYSRRGPPVTGDTGIHDRHVSIAGILLPTAVASMSMPNDSGVHRRAAFCAPGATLC